jgi:hypothetical protein
MPGLRAGLLTIGAMGGWFALSVALRAMGYESISQWLLLAGFTVALPVCFLWGRWSVKQSNVVRWVVGSVVFVVLWQACVFFFDWGATVDRNHADGWLSMRAQTAWLGLAGLFCIGLGWVVWAVERVAQRYESERLANEVLHHTEGDIISRRRGALHVSHAGGRIWNPLDPAAWYYGNKSPRLSQSMTALGSYSLAFIVICTLVSFLQGCEEIYESPGGGGKQVTVAQVMKIQKVIKKKLVVNPYSSIIFNPPPIDDVKLQLKEVTAHNYTVGYGEGDGAGFSGGTARGKVRFIRLEHSGSRWNDNMGISGDGNMLREYGIRTGHKVAEVTESRTIAQLGNFTLGKSPPVVYITGESIGLSKREIEILRDYLTVKHGMLFADNGGPGFHNQFLVTMRQVLPQAEPVKIPLDDVIQLQPKAVPFLPYVTLHGGIKHALGWKVDGRWVCYYHPGDIGDAWSDDHSGVNREIYEACYDLGTNILFYAHVEYNRWLDAQKK